LKGKNVLVTGASRGIGASISSYCKELGANVFTPTRMEMDLSSIKSINRYVSNLSTPIDVIINNAGLNILAELNEIDEKIYNKMLQVNVNGPLNLIRMLVPRMKKNKYGRIVNISSVYSVCSRHRRIIYSITKSALNGMTKALAVELSAYNILVNAVAPGFVNTELTRINNTPEELALISNNLPIRRLAEPIEIARVVGFFASSLNTYITGQVIFVDGGFTCI
jgi:3-oxoacyl-[acyl-carrier protein] reductase